LALRAAVTGAVASRVAKYPRLAPMNRIRRELLGVLAAVPVLALARPKDPARGPWERSRLEKEVRRLERESGGRLGFALLDTGSGARFQHRGDERFPMCSTFKLLLVAAVLERARHGEDSLARRIPVRKEDVVPWAPFAETRVGADASVEELCAAAMTQSDNVAANLLLATIGGPAGIGSYARTLGDAYTRLDRRETELNSAIPGDPRDTTTPLAMLGNLQALLLGDALPAAARERLLGWLRANTTGDARLRAGLPKDWRVGDKTGSGANGTTNDIAILWPHGEGAPLLVAAYLTGSKLDSERRDAVHAALGRALSAR
jgi:beta-lactamase class A